MDELFNEDIIFSAYKKLKHYFYYDNTSLLVKQRISEFETKNLIEGDFLGLKRKLFSIIEIFLKLDLEQQSEVFNLNDLLNRPHIDFHLLPKTFKKISRSYITNVPHEDDLKLKRINIFIDASVEVHLISVLWLMFAGKYLTREIGTHNYAYELQLNEDDQDGKIVDGLRLYKPYFIQYQKWRDNAISKAEDLLKDKKDVTILSLDIKDYFHSVELDFDQIKSDIKNIIDLKIKKSNNEIEKNGYSRDQSRINVLCDLLCNIHKVYKVKILKIKPSLEGREFAPLPIGLMSSGLLGNYYLKNFDSNIIDQLNPAYYGRYVDDLMFVFPNMKIDATNSSTIDVFLDRYFVDRNLLSLNSSSVFDRESYDKQSPREYNLDGYPNMIIQSEKVILHHFNHKESKAALNKFKKKLEDQRSEFRFLPDEDKLTSDFDEEAFSLQYSDSINKFRSIQELSEDKYGASKFLAQKIFARSYGDKENDLESDNQILTFFKGYVGLSFFSLWEKVATYFVITDNAANIVKFTRHILRSINNISYSELDTELDIKLVRKYIQNNLELFLKASISVPLALNPSIIFDVSKQEEKSFFEECRMIAIEIRKSNMFRHALIHIPSVNYTFYTTINNWGSNLLEFKEDLLFDNSSEYEKLIELAKFDVNFIYPDSKLGMELESKVSLLQSYNRLAILSPRYVYFHEVNIKKIYEAVISIDEETIKKTKYLTKKGNRAQEIPNISQIDTEKEPQLDLVNAIPDNAFKEYWVINYSWRVNAKSKEHGLKEKYFNISSKEVCGEIIENYVDVRGEDKKNIVDKKIAIGNIKVEQTNILKSINQKPNLSRDRRKELFDLLNEADKQRCDLFVLPEVSVPFSWIKLLAYRSHKRDVGIIAGLEHWINSGNFAFNFMLTILPVKLDEYTTSIIKIRLKNHYAHDEKELLKGHRLLIPRDTIIEYPKSYDLFHWRNTYFSVYNCFELADIYDRGLFKSKVDFIVAAEFNRDTGYFSDIAGSWVRDIHCYFVQVNTSHYGDSRLIQPAKSYAKDLIQIKGGLNSTILVGELKIEDLREFQLVEYNLQKEKIDKGLTVLKPTPPDFNRNNVRIRINNKSFK